MIKGTATLLLNEETIREAVQEWLAKRMACGECPTVTKVDYQKGQGYSDPSGFLVSLQEAPPPVPPQEHPTP